MSAFFNNAEMLRNARIQLRPGRAIAAVGKVKEVAERPERLYSRISSGEVM